MGFNAAQIIFLFAAAVMLISALLAVSVRNLVHAALWMVLSFLGVAVLFVLLGSGFFAVVQVVIYIGAIAVMILFVVMLTTRDQHEKLPTHTTNLWLVAITVLVLLVVLSLAIQAFSPAPVYLTTQPDDGLASALGRALVSPNQFGLVFELASILLLVALIGAIYLAQERNANQGGQS